MKDKIIELHKEGKSVREIESITGVPKSSVQRIVSQDLSVPDSCPTEEFKEVSQLKFDKEVIERIRMCPFRRDKQTCKQYKEVNNIGIHMLRVCDYNLNEQSVSYFKDMPYFDCI